ILDLLLARLDLEAKVRLLTGASAWTTYGADSIGLRPIVMSDGPAGVRGQTWDERDTSANLPSPTAVAASWDERLVERLGVLFARRGPPQGRRRGPRPPRHPAPLPARRPPFRVVLRGSPAVRPARHRLRADDPAERCGGDAQALRRERLGDRPDDARRPGRRA